MENDRPPSPEFRQSSTTKCSCGHCEGHLEFDTADAGRRVACPHCGKETVLYIPGQTAPPQPPSAAVVPAPPVAPPVRTLDHAAPARKPTRPTVAPRRSARARETGSFASQAARASWIVFVVALLSSGFMGSASEQTKRFLLNAVPILMLLGVIVGVIALFGIRKYGIRGILIPALIGILLNGGFLTGLHRARQKHASTRHQQAEEARKKVAATAEAFRQAADHGQITNVAATGDAGFDATIRIWADILNKVTALRESMDSQIKSLDDREFFTVIASKAAIKSEMDKKLAAQKLIEKHQQDFTATVEAARQKLRALNLPKEAERRELSSLASSGTFCTYMDASYSLRSRLQKAEFELYQFLWSEFGRYRIANAQVLFYSQPKLDEFRRLTGNIRNITAEGQELERQREANLQDTRERLKQTLQ